MNILCPGQKGGKGKAKIRGGFSLTTSKGIKPFKRIFRRLDFDYRASYFIGSIPV